MNRREIILQALRDLSSTCAIEESRIISTENMTTPREIYQLKVTLQGTRPPIWRRLLVPANLNLEQLHSVLQAAMGWENCHMHDFRIGARRFGTPDPNERYFGGPITISGRGIRLSSVLGRVGAKALYTYDFGDGWEHAIVVEKILASESGRAYPECIDGKRHGPPEDCGGVPGFDNLLEAIRDPNHEQHEDLIDWLGDDFDPEAFSPHEVNRRLALLHRRRSTSLVRTRPSRRKSGDA